MNGGHGQIVQQHVVLESKQEPEHVLMTLQTLASHSVSKGAALWLHHFLHHFFARSRKRLQNMACESRRRLKI